MFTVVLLIVGNVDFCVSATNLANKNRLENPLGFPK